MLPRSKQTSTSVKLHHPDLLHHKWERIMKKSHPKSITGVPRVLLVRVNDSLKSLRISKSVHPPHIIKATIPKSQTWISRSE
jgi:hypothetical protein